MTRLSPTPCRPADAAGAPGDEDGEVAGAQAVPQPGAIQRLAERLRRDDVWAQFARFVLVGGSTTVVYAALFIALERYGYLTAHLLATAASTVLANELHRRLTFHADDRVGWWTAQWEAGGVTIIGLVATSATLGWLDSISATAHVALQITCVVTVTALIGLMRFIALRWIFRGPSTDEA